MEYLNGPLDFPSVSICNINPIRYSQLGRTPILKDFLDGMADELSTDLRPAPRENNTRDQTTIGPDQENYDNPDYYVDDIHVDDSVSAPKYVIHLL